VRYALSLLGVVTGGFGVGLLSVGADGEVVAGTIGVTVGGVDICDGTGGSRS